MAPARQLSGYQPFFVSLDFVIPIAICLSSCLLFPWAVILQGWPQIIVRLHLTISLSLFSHTMYFHDLFQSVHKSLCSASWSPAGIFPHSIFTVFPLDMSEPSQSGLGGLICKPLTPLYSFLILCTLIGQHKTSKIISTKLQKVM